MEANNNNQELYDKLKQSLKCKKPNIDSLKSCLIDCGYPDEDKRGEPNLANEIKEYVLTNYSSEIESSNYDSILKWILESNNEMQIKEMISDLVCEVERVYFWNKQYDDFIEYVKLPLMQTINEDMIHNDDYLTIYYSEINQVTDQLITLNRLDSSNNYLFDYDGKCLNDTIRYLIQEKYEENYFGGNLNININNDNVITVIEWGNGYYFPSCSYLLKYSEQKLELIKKIDDDFEINTDKSKNTAIEVSKMFFEEYESTISQVQVFGDLVEAHFLKFKEELNERLNKKANEIFNSYSSVPENNINSPVEQESIDSDVVQYDNLSITSDFSLSGEFHLFSVQMPDYKAHEMVFTCFDQNQFVVRGDGFVGIGKYIYVDSSQLEGFYTWKYDNDELKGETLIHIDNNGVFTGKVYILNDQNEKEFSWEYIAKKVRTENQNMHLESEDTLKNERVFDFNDLSWLPKIDDPIVEFPGLIENSCESENVQDSFSSFTFQSEQISTQEKYNRLNLNLKINKPDANALRAIMITSEYPDGANFASDLMNHFSHFDEVNTDYIEWEDVIRWVINKSTDNQILELFKICNFNSKYLYSWEESNFEDETYLYLELSKYETDKELHDDLKKEYFCEIKQISDQFVVLHGVESFDDYLFDYNGEFLNRKLIDFIVHNDGNSLYFNDFTIQLGKGNLLLVTGSVDDFDIEIPGHIVEWDSDGFKFIKRLDSYSDIAQIQSDYVYLEANKISKLYIESLKNNLDSILSHTEIEENKNERELLIEKLRENGLALENASQNLKNEKDIVLLAVKKKGLALQFASEELRNDKEIVLEAIHDNSNALEFATNELQNDREIVLKAIQNKGLALQFASEELKNDLEIVLIAIKSNISAIKFASNGLKNNRLVLFECIRKDGLALEFASDKLKNDSDLALLAIKNNAEAYEYISDELKNNYSFNLKAGKIKHTVFKFASESFKYEIKTNRYLLMEALNTYPLILQYTSYKFQSDPEIVLKAAEINSSNLAYASDELKNNRAFVLEVANKISKEHCLSYISDDLKNDKDIVKAFVKNYGTDFRYASDELKKDIDFVLEVFELNVLALQYASEEFRNDRAMVLQAVKLNGSILKNVSEELRNDRDIVLVAIKNNIFALEFASDDLKKDKALVLEAIKLSSSAFQYASEDLKKDRGFVLEAVKLWGDSLEHASWELKKDREVVLEAVKSDGSAIEFASEELHKDNEIVLRALNITIPFTIENLEEIWNDREFIIQVLKGNYRNINYFIYCLSEKLKNDREIAQEIIKKDWSFLDFLPDKFKNDREIVAIALNQNGRVLVNVHEDLKNDREMGLLAAKCYGYFSISDKLKNDREILLVAIRNSADEIRCAPDKFKNDREIILEAVKKQGDTLRYASDELKKDREIVVEAVNSRGNSIQYASEQLRNDKSIALIAMKNSISAFEYISYELKSDQELQDIYLEYIIQEEMKKRY